MIFQNHTDNWQSPRIKHDIMIISCLLFDRLVKSDLKSMHCKASTLRGAGITSGSVQLKLKIHGKKISESVNRLDVSNSLQSHGLQPARLLCPWNSPGKNTGVGCHSLLQGVFSNQGWNPGSPALWADSLPSVPPWQPYERSMHYILTSGTVIPKP